MIFYYNKKIKERAKGIKKDDGQKVDQIREFYYKMDLDDKENLNFVENFTHKLKMPDSSMMKSFLGKVLKRVQGKATRELYENLITLAYFEIKSLENKIDYITDIKEIWNEMDNRKHYSTVLKQARRFYYIASNINGNPCEDCDVAPTYWFEVSNDSWNNLLDEFSLKQGWEQYEKLIKKN